MPGLAQYVDLTSISIHAPPRGATSRTSQRCWQRWKFQFTPLREGRRRIGRSDVPCGLAFKSRPSERGDGFEPVEEEAVPAQFNSRPSARGDGLIRHAAFNTFGVQFTPLREGRQERTGCSGTSGRSIHAPPRGATAGLRRISASGWTFNSRPSARGDGRCRTSASAARRTSIHAPPRGATAAKDMQFLQIFCSTLTNQHGLTIVPRNLSRLFW